jgi:hypothetical protein
MAATSSARTSGTNPSKSTNAAGPLPVTRARSIPAAPPLAEISGVWTSV